MLYDRGLQTAEQIREHKKELSRRFNSLDPNRYISGGHIGSLICDGCNHLISDSICLCAGVFTCPNCGFENGKLIKQSIENFRNK